jgi:uncharacterized membrane protein HdeD (DUF308 family)
MTEEKRRRKMKRYEVFDVFADQFSSLWKSSIVFGAASLLFGIAIVFFPQILIFLIATFFITTGVTSLLFAWRCRSYRKTYYDTLRFTIDDLFS